jgi:hypothetical protein
MNYCARYEALMAVTRKITVFFFFGYLFTCKSIIKVVKPTGCRKSLNELNVCAKQLLKNITVSYIITNYKFI